MKENGAKSNAVDRKFAIGGKYDSLDFKEKGIVMYHLRKLCGGAHNTWNNRLFHWKHGDDYPVKERDLDVAYDLIMNDRWRVSVEDLSLV